MNFVTARQGTVISVHATDTDEIHATLQNGKNRFFVVGNSSHNDVLQLANHVYVIGTMFSFVGKCQQHHVGIELIIANLVDQTQNDMLSMIGSQVMGQGHNAGPD